MIQRERDRVCVCACVRACVRARARVCMCVCVEGVQDVQTSTFHILDVPFIAEPSK